MAASHAEACTAWYDSDLAWRGARLPTKRASSPLSVSYAGSSAELCRDIRCRQYRRLVLSNESQFHLNE